MSRFVRLSSRLLVAMFVAQAAVSQSYSTVRESLERLCHGQPSARQVESFAESFFAVSDAGGFAKLAPGEWRSLIDRARPVVRKHAGSAHQVYFELGVGWAQMTRGEFAEACDTYLWIDRQFADVDFERAYRMEMLAQALRWNGRPTEALAALDRAERLAREAPEALAEVHGHRGEIYLEQGMLDLAAREFERSRSHVASIDDADAAAEARRNAALREFEFEIGRGRFREVWNATSAWLESIRSDDPRPEFARSVALYRAVAAAGIEYRDPNFRESERQFEALLARGALPADLDLWARLKLLEVVMRDHGVDRARPLHADCRVRVSEARRVRTAHRDLFASLDAWFHTAAGSGAAELRRSKDALRERFDAQLRCWARASDRPGGTGFLHLDDRRSVVGQLCELEIELARREERSDGAERALAVLLEAQAMNSIARARGAAACSVEDVQRVLLPHGGTAIVFLPWKRLSRAYLVTRDRVVSEALPPRSTLLPRVRAELEWLSRDPRTDSDSDRVGRRLMRGMAALRASLIPSDWLATIRAERSMVAVGGELLKDIALEALVLDDDLLGEVVAVTNSASLPLLVHQARSRPKPTEPSLRLLGCLDTEVAGLRDEPRVDLRTLESVEQITAMYDSTASTFDRDVTRRLVAESDFAAHSVLHWIAHSVRRDDAELRLGLALADGPFWHDEFLAQRFRGVVLLGACAAGRSAARPGDSALATNLGGAFMRGGADVVVQPDLPVEVRDHLELMRVVHESIVTGRSPAEGLRRGRAQLRGQDRTARFRRAQVRAFGDGHRLISPGK